MKQRMRFFYLTVSSRVPLLHNTCTQVSPSFVYSKPGQPLPEGRIRYGFSFTASEQQSSRLSRISPADVSENSTNARPSLIQNLVRSAWFSSLATTYALLALNGTSRIRGFHFPSELYSQLVKCIKKTWPEGMEWATLQSDDSWHCLLRGTPWKKKGSGEVEYAVR